MKNYKSLILVWLLTLIFGSVYAQTEKPKLTLVRNSYKEMQGKLSDDQLIVYKDKLYMGYYHKEASGRALVTFDGQNWTSSIYTSKDGKIVGGNYSYTGKAVIYKDLLFMVFKDNAKKKEVIAYTDGKTIKYLSVDADYMRYLLATPDKLYIVCQNSYSDNRYLWTYDGKKVKRLAMLPHAQNASINSMVYYKGKIRLKGEGHLYTLTEDKFSDIRANTSAQNEHVIWKDELCYLAKRPLKEPCRDKEGRYVKEGFRMLSFDGEKTNTLYYLAEKHTSVHNMKVIDGDLYSTQQSCETGKSSFCVSRGNKRAKAYTYAASCMGDFIKYKGSIFVGYRYHSKQLDRPDNFLTSWTFDSNNRLDFKRIKDDYIYIDGKVNKVSIRYSGYPVVFKNELYLIYDGNGKSYGNGTYLMKYTP